MEAPRVTEELHLKDVPSEPSRRAPASTDSNPSSRTTEPENPAWMVPVSMLLFLLIAVGFTLAFLG
jgi:hypothetical protein